MQMYIAGKWVDKAETMDVINPYDGSFIDTVPKGDPSDVEAAIASAERGAKVMAAMSAYERYQIIHRAADLMLEELDDLGRTITLEEGKVIAEGRTGGSMRRVPLEGLHAGNDGDAAVGDYKAPSAFNGTIEKLTLRLGKAR